MTLKHAIFFIFRFGDDYNFFSKMNSKQFKVVTIRNSSKFSLVFINYLFSFLVNYSVYTYQPIGHSIKIPMKYMKAVYCYERC